MKRHRNSIIRQSALALLAILGLHSQVLALDPPSANESPAFWAQQENKRLEALKLAKVAEEKADRAKRDLEIEKKKYEDIQRQLNELKAANASQSKPLPLESKGATAANVFKDNCTLCPEMVVIPAGSFTMGSNYSAGEQPLRVVALNRFALAQTETTIAQYLACVNAGACKPPEWLEAGSIYNHQSGKEKDYYATRGQSLSAATNPITGVSWGDAVRYVQWLSQQTGQRYHLPSEAQWEYAARAGSTARFGFGDDEAQLTQYAWFSSNSNGKAQAVKQKQANGFGLFDMHGNVWEWTQDCWNTSYQNAPSNGSAWESGDCSQRVLRGGSWSKIPAILRSATRFGVSAVNRNIIVGFRPARTLP